ncbi:sodium:solute symporter family protein [Candidatus Latescibacterota bacterium]
MPGFQSHMTVLDWSVVLFYLLAMLVIGLSVSKRAGSSLAEFFLSGRKLTWFVAGASLIATSFASDTPLWVSGLVRRFGIYAAWQYWCPAIGAGLAVFLFAGLWRRLGVLTDIEMIEVRYEGKWAAALRGLYALWGSLIMNAFIMGWVTKAMESILSETLGVTAAYKGFVVGLAITIALVYCAFSGLTGVVLTDTIQLVLATFGTIALAFFSVRAVGGLDVMVDKLEALENWPGASLSLRPRVGNGPGFLSVWNTLAFISLYWWPVALAGGFNAQRLLATRDERHSSLAMLLYTIVYWAVNAWPWVLVALCSLILLPGFDGGPAEELAYPHMMMTYLPQGLRGMLFVAMLAAFMSTISTIINFGSSYFVNDFYKRFVSRSRPERHYVLIARLVSVLMAVLGGLTALFADSIQVLIQIGMTLWSVTAFLAILRWLWWRMTARAEFAGLIAGLGCTVLILGFKVFNGPARMFFGTTGSDGMPLMFDTDYDYYGLRLLLVVGTTCTVTMITALLSSPTSTAVLKDFVRRTRPLKFFWRSFVKKSGVDYPSREHLGEVLKGWAIVTVCIYSLLFAIGKLLLGDMLTGAGLLTVFAVSLVWTVRSINRHFTIGIAKDE